MGLSIDRDKVIKGLTFCSTGMCFDGCPYHKVSQNIDECTSQLALEALELLKEQEPIKPKSKVRHGENGQIQHWCGNCMAMLHGKPKYCSNCGRQVKWE